MKLVLFDDYRPGVLNNGAVVDVSAATAALGVASYRRLMPTVIEQFDRLRPAFERIASSDPGRPIGDVRLRAPNPAPPKLLACFGNYTEVARTERSIQDMFLKNPDGVIGDGDTVELPPHAATVFHHEAELGIVMGRRCRDLTVDEAKGAIFGYTCIVDVSARGLSIAGTNSRMGKSFDGFGPMGPCIATADEIPDPNGLQVRFWMDGELRQDYSTEGMEYSVPEVVSWVSRHLTLLPGDVISCGTNHLGLGPMQDGERAEMEIERIGRFRFFVRDPSNRRWPKSIDRTETNPLFRPGAMSSDAPRGG
ncbi:MAG: fumarylacetoacetate hydrolase [Chloroflexi bacterium]|nr:fumarylacetoacetate hydrolase [Chloroflexota bacterium]